MTEHITGPSDSPAARPGLRSRWAQRTIRLLRHWNLTAGRSLLLCWALGRMIVFLVWGLLTPETQGDVVYYYEHIDHMFTAGPEATMREYPTPVLWLLTLPWLLGFGTQAGYVIAFVVLMLALDVWFTLRLWHLGGRLRGHAVLFWTLFVVCIGPTIYLRFDLVTTVLAGGALLMLVRRRLVGAGVLTGVGAAIKLWPALLWPALCGGDARRKWAVSVGFWATGGALALASLWWAGWDRLLSPLTWQSGRGLQVESVWASVPMLARALGRGDYAVTISRYQAFEVYGTGVPFWSAVASIATAVGLLGIAVGYILWWRRGHADALAAAALMLLVVLVMIATNKTFSPQYMIWLGGPAAAAFVILGRHRSDGPGYAAQRRRLWTIAVAILGITLLTAVVFPIGYDPLVRDTRVAGWFRLPVTIVLVVRNVAVCALLGYVVHWVLGLLGVRRKATPDQPPTVREER